MRHHALLVGRVPVQDDGVGMTDGAEKPDGGGLGMKLVHAFVDQLKGTIAVDGDNGMKVTVTFKLAEEPEHG